MPGSEHLQIKLLGELSASWDDAPLDLGGRRQRAVLAVLLLARGDVVPAERLVDAVWGDGASDRSVGALQAYVSHLRRSLQPHTPARARSSVIVREGPGYAVRQPPESVDAWRFEELLARAEQTSNPHERAAVLTEALGLWRGPFLVEYADEPWAEAEVARLTELRSVARERLLAARLDVGEPGLLVPELEAMVAEEPLREERWRLLVVALYRAQRQADALRELRRARTRLAEELGVDPGPALRQLEAEVLAQSPSLDVPRQRRTDEGLARAAPARPDTDDLIEREHEYAALADALDAVAEGRSGLVLVEGPVGIGKTCLLREAERMAVDRSVRVLRARGSELERAFAFGVVRQLLEPELRDPDRRTGLLQGPAAEAREIFDDGHSHDGAGADDATDFTALHGLHGLLVNLGASGPLLLAVDDAQWCDRASLRFLAYLARRLSTVPVLLVATVRTEGATAEDAALLDELALEPNAVVLRPAPFTESATAALVERRLRSTPASRFAEACHRTTDGNPLLLTLLLRGLATDGVRPDAAHADRVVAVGGRAVASAVMVRLRRLDEDATEVARAAAVLGDGATLPVLAQLAGLSEDRAAAALSALTRAHVVADQHPLAFVHPLVREAIHRVTPAAECGLLHERAAATLRAHGGSDEQVAAHLLLAPARPDADTMTLLRRAAASAARRGASESALTYLRRAVAQAPGGRVPPDLEAELVALEAASAPDTTGSGFPQDRQATMAGSSVVPSQGRRQP